MTGLELTFTGAEVLRPGEGLCARTLSIGEGHILADPAGRVVDLSGYLILPGIVDLHGDAFERHLAPRRGAMPDMAEGVIATEAELAANGITTGVLAQFYSWEGGVRGPEYAAQVFAAIREAQPQVVTDLRAQLRFETHMLDDYEGLPQKIADWGVSYLVFNDHLPHDRLAAGKVPARLTGQALKAGRNPEVHLAMLQEMHARSAEVPAAIDRLIGRLAGQGIRFGSHDDHTAEDRATWRARGATIAEFPETHAAALAAHEAGDGVIFGAPNAARGNSHKGNVSAAEMVAEGLCDALASDYHYPSLRRAVLKLVREGVCDLARGWALLSEGPARLLGLEDRGRLAPGLRADLVILDTATGRVAATLADGRISYMSGEVAARFI